MAEFCQFYWDWFYMAGAKTTSFIIEEFWLFFAVFPIGLYFHWKTCGPQACREEWRVFMSWGVWAVVILTGGMFLVNLSLAPYEIYKEAKEETLRVRGEPQFIWSLESNKEQGVATLIVSSNFEFVPFGIKIIADSPIKGASLWVVDEFDTRPRLNGARGDDYIVSTHTGIKPGHPWRIYLYSDQPLENIKIEEFVEP